MSADSQYTSSTFPAAVRRKLGTSSSCAEPYKAVRIWAVEWKGAWPSSGMRTTRTEPSMAGGGVEGGEGGTAGGEGGGGGGEGGGEGGDGPFLQYPQVNSQFKKKYSCPAPIAPLHLVYFNADVGNSALQNSGIASSHGGGGGGEGGGDSLQTAATSPSR
eukprot:scaffold16146_cov65-Phaeocystis_antarctica.AAC.3